MSNIKYLTENETHYCRTHEQAFEYAQSWIKANEHRVSDVSLSINDHRSRMVCEDSRSFGTC